MHSNVVTFEYENGKFSLATKVVLRLCKMGLIKLSNNYLPIYKDEDDSEVGGIYCATGAKPIVDFVAWLTDYAMSRRSKGNLWQVDILPDGSMVGTKI